MSTGIVITSVPVAVKPSRPDRWPSWNTQTSAPKVADSDSRFSTIALTGISTEPKDRNRTTKVISAITTERERQPVEQAGLAVDELGRGSPDERCRRVRRRPAPAATSASPSSEIGSIDGITFR